MRLENYVTRKFYEQMRKNSDIKLYEMLTVLRKCCIKKFDILKDPIALLALYVESRNCGIFENRKLFNLDEFKQTIGQITGEKVTFTIEQRFY
jgi:hypothetical protein